MQELAHGTRFTVANLANAESSVVNPEDLVHDQDPNKYISQVKRLMSRAFTSDEHKEQSYEEVKEN
jgi:hypothetical protein